MPGKVHFVCLLHSHQPVGNFDKVIEEAFQKSYLPYVQLFEEFPSIPLTNHFSGCLLAWLEQHHPEYFQRLRRHRNALGFDCFGGAEWGFCDYFLAFSAGSTARSIGSGLVSSMPGGARSWRHGMLRFHTMILETGPPASR